MRNLHNMALCFAIYYIAKLCLFGFGATFAASNREFIDICSCVIGGWFWGILSIRG